MSTRDMAHLRRSYSKSSDGCEFQHSGRGMAEITRVRVR
jgi:hypothetical protein